MNHRQKRFKQKLETNCSFFFSSMLYRAYMPIFLSSILFFSKIKYNL
jgi:hypothetical protein